ncbi:Mu transposase C-terminal domain-containing protein [Bacillus cereus]|uniref:Mu transposase C-terminal domain-containing protein n=1 Tax=Bacillus cereus TaxID=1396 RepID=UPI0036F459CE
MIILSVNEQIKDMDNSKVYRVLWIDEGSVIVYLIDIYDEKALPFAEKIKTIYEGLSSGKYAEVKEPYYHSVTNFGELNKKDILIRDRAWDLIGDLVIQEPEIYKPRERGKLIRELLKKEEISNKTIYKYLKRYWQRGKVKNGLLPDYKNCGNKGKSKNWGDNKTGRRRINNSTGINVTAEIKRVFEKAVKKYYFTDPNNTLTYTYKMMIRQYFQADVRYKENIKYIVIEDENSIPTLRQFRYWFNKRYGTEEIISSKHGKKTFERDHRAILGSSTFEVFGPGSRYQIDATKANVYIISRYNSQWILERPTVYYVVDVYTHLIVGFYVGLESPSWMGMMMALLNATTNKVEFCEKYGMHITEECWPAAHLPEVILGDRGELEGFNVNHLIQGLNVTVENNPAYRPDWKGIVEKLFDTSQEKIRPFLPGYVSKDWGKRGAKDPRLQAKLDIEQYTKIIINFILHYNKNFYMKEYIRDSDMIEDNVTPTPTELWKWGVINRAGKLRTVHPEIMKFYLMPRGTATVTPKGIRFQKLLYCCETAIQDSWFTTARSKKSWKVDISYDPRNMNYIYIHTKDERIFESCYLLEHQERYQDKVLEEIKQLHQLESKNFKDREHNLLQSEINFIDSIEAIVKDAIKETNEKQVDNVSKTRKREKIKEHTRFEKEMRRKEEVFNLDNIGDKDKEDVISIEQKNDFKRHSVKDLFNNKRGRSK